MVPAKLKPHDCSRVVISPPMVTEEIDLLDLMCHKGGPQWVGNASKGNLLHLKSLEGIDL